MMNETIRALLMAAAIIAAVVSTLLLIAMCARERRARRFDAPVPFADYDERNPINQGGRRWTPSRTRGDDRPGYSQLEGGAEPETWVSESGTVYYIVRPMR